MKTSGRSRVARGSTRALHALPVAALLFLSLVSNALAIRECVSSSAPNAIVRQKGDDEYNFAVSRSLYPQPPPAWLVEVSDAKEVAVVVNCAAGEGLKVCPRTGGHSFTGRAHCTGVMIDVINLKSFSYDQGNNQISVGAGNTVSADLDKIRNVKLDTP